MDKAHLPYRIFCLAVSIAMAAGLAGCSESAAPAQTTRSDKTITSSILQDSPVTIGIDTSGGLDIVQQGVNFDVTKDGSIVAYGFLMLKADYDSYVSSAKTADDCTETTINGADAITYTDGSTYEALVAIPDASTFVHILDTESTDSLNEVLSALTFSSAR